jgi:hypothetical protein
MATRPQSNSAKSGKPAGSVLGRSAATGRYVLNPASKAGSISVRDAKTAATHISSNKKK